LDAVRTVEETTFELRGDNVEDILHDWLAELLYTFHARRLVLAEFQVQVEEQGGRVGASTHPTDLWCGRPGCTEAGETPAPQENANQKIGIVATARGEPIDLKRHEIDNEVKAITWCGLKVERSADGWLAEVIVDI
jgi:SHS2 domain-containing protein